MTAMLGWFSLDDNAPPGEADRARLCPPAGVVDVGNAAPLIRYSRTLNGVKAAYEGSKLSVQGFAAKTDTLYSRDEIQGNGLSGPYRLRARGMHLHMPLSVPLEHTRLRAQHLNNCPADKARPRRSLAR